MAVPERLRAWSLETVFTSPEEKQHINANAPPDVWRRGQRLGSGGFGDVFQESCVAGPRRDQIRAVKQIRKTREALRLLGRELDVLVTFSTNDNNHESVDNFVRFLGWFGDQTYLYIAMELVPYGDLQSHIATKPCPETETAAIVGQVGRALQYMHYKGYVHRDLKPANILVARPRPDWHVKLTDFGISKNTENTALRTRVGTEAYMAPELFDEDANSPGTFTSAVDVWSLGAVAFCARTGQAPFASVYDLAMFHSGKKRFPTRPLMSSSGAFFEFIFSLMEKSPKERLTMEQALQHEWMVSAGAFSAPRIETLRPDSPGDEWDAQASAMWDTSVPSPAQSSVSLGLPDSQDTIRPNPRTGGGSLLARAESSPAEQSKSMAPALQASISHPALLYAGPTMTELSKDLPQIFPTGSTKSFQQPRLPSHLPTPAEALARTLTGENNIRPPSTLAPIEPGRRKPLTKYGRFPIKNPPPSEPSGSGVPQGEATPVPAQRWTRNRPPPDPVFAANLLEDLAAVQREFPNISQADSRHLPPRFQDDHDNKEFETRRNIPGGNKYKTDDGIANDYGIPPPLKYVPYTLERPVSRPSNDEEGRSESAAPPDLGTINSGIQMPPRLSDTPDLDWSTTLSPPAWPANGGEPQEERSPPLARGRPRAIHGAPPAMPPRPMVNQKSESRRPAADGKKLEQQPAMSNARTGTPLPAYSVEDFLEQLRGHPELLRLRKTIHAGQIDLFKAAPILGDMGCGGSQNLRILKRHMAEVVKLIETVERDQDINDLARPLCTYFERIKDTEEGRSLEFLRENQFFQRIRTAMIEDPTMLEPILQQIGRSNPQLATMIAENGDQFLAIISEGMEGNEEPTSEGPIAISVTEEERDAIVRLTTLGFDRDYVIQVYFACERDEAMAKAFLMESGET